MPDFVRKVATRIVVLVLTLPDKSCLISPNQFLSLYFMYNQSEYRGMWLKKATQLPGPSSMSSRLTSLLDLFLVFLGLVNIN